MANGKQHNLTDEDILTIISLIKQRTLHRKQAAEYKKLSEKSMIESRRLTNTCISNKIGASRSTIMRISNCSMMHDRIKRLDPEFYNSRIWLQ